MSRPLRLEFPGAVWHVTSRGNERREIFRDDEDRRLFLRLLGRTVIRHRWRLHAFVLMTNHHHLLIETPIPNLSRGMHELNGAYALKFNQRYNRVGHLLQGRFKGILVSKETHLLELTRYVVLNPVRAGLVDLPEAWPWSSYLATARLVPRPVWLEVAWTLSHFGSTDETATSSYVEFVTAARGSRPQPFADLRGQIFLGDERFRNRMRDEISRVRISDEVPRAQQEIQSVDLELLIQATATVTGTTVHAIRKGRGGEIRMLVAALARQETSAPLRIIGDALSVHGSRVSRLAREGLKRQQMDQSFRATVNRILVQLRGPTGGKTKGKT